MKIQKVIHSSNSNPLYLDFWPIVSKIWKLYFNIEPILLYLNDKELDIDSTYGSVIKINPIEKIPIELQTLWVRYWYPSTEPETIFMISDIDMIPLSKEYFIYLIDKYDENSYLHINPCIDTYGLIPSCYHIAKGKKFQHVLETDISFEKDLLKLVSFDNTHSNGWFNDEKYATAKVLQYRKHSNDLFLIPRKNGQNGHRIDRTHWSYDPNLVKSGYYYDSHSIRPYSQYKSHIDALCNILLGEV